MANLEQRNNIDDPVLKAVSAIKTAVLQGQYEAAKDVNRVQLALYYAVGRFLSNNTRKGVWGIGALEAISERLRKELPGLRGFSVSSLKNMRLFFEEWSMLDANSPIAIGESQHNENQKNTNSPITTGELNYSATPDTIDINHALQVPIASGFPIEDFFRVPFTHHIRIIERVKDLKTRYYYIHRTAEEHLSIEQLVQRISESAHEHDTLIPNNFSQTIQNASDARKAVMMFKDEYLLNFINVEELGMHDEDIDEEVIESNIVHNVKNFIMTFGKGFSFSGSQVHYDKLGHDHWIDLLFFNRDLNRTVVFELKKGRFKVGYLAQLSAYLRILNDDDRRDHEEAPIGIILCKNVDKNYAGYIMQDFKQPMGVASYKFADEMDSEILKALPPKEDLQRVFEESSKKED